MQFKLKQSQSIDYYYTIPCYALPETCPDSYMVYGIATDCQLFLSTLWVRIPRGACEKVASELQLGGGFHWVQQFPHQLQLASQSQLSRIMAEERNS